MKFDPAVPVAVFLGPSLDHASAAAILGANYYPPVRMGDIYRLATCGVRLIVIIDGVFHGTAPVWQREIVAAMQNGVAVVGASSMGALRAIELEAAGMIGIGTIVEWYRERAIEGDDEVALMHAEAEFGYRGLSEPLVNIRWTMREAASSGIITAGQAEALVAEMHDLDHASRSYEALFGSAAGAALAPEAAAGLRTFVSASASLKEQDAVQALSWCRDHLAELVGTRAPAPDQGRSILRLNELMLRGVPAPDHALPAVRDLLVRATADRARVAHAVNHASRRFYLLDWARGAAVAPPDGVVEAFVERWSAEHGAADRAAWQAANGMTSAELENELNERAVAAWLLDRGPSACGLDRPFLEAWAARAGVDRPDPTMTSEAFRAWLVEKTPNYFGFDQWSADVALARDLQISGDMARLAAGWREPAHTMAGADAGTGAV